MFLKNYFKAFGVVSSFLFCRENSAGALVKPTEFSHSSWIRAITLRSYAPFYWLSCQQILSFFAITWNVIIACRFFFYFIVLSWTIYMYMYIAVTVIFLAQIQLFFLGKGGIVVNLRKNLICWESKFLYLCVHLKSRLNF